MKRDFVFRTAVVALAGGTLIFSSACSKGSDDSTSTATPTPTATPTATVRATASPTLAPSPASSPLANTDTHLRDLETQMDNIFANTFRDFGSAFGQRGLGSSIDLREQKDR